MFTTVQFCSRTEAETIPPRAPALLIAIGAPDYPVSRIPEGWYTEIVRASFHDLYEERWEPHKEALPSPPWGFVPETVRYKDRLYVRPTLRHAEVIFRSIRRYQESLDLLSLVIHCEAGVSRSAAVADWAARYCRIPIMTSRPLTAANKRLTRLLDFVERNHAYILTPRNGPIL